MAFWRTETLASRIPDGGLVAPFREENITHSSYELCIGHEAFVTSTSDKVKIELEEGESLVIPPGQFALLLTEEEVKVPLDAIAFISMRFKVKRRGLINVSGFHVDPGFAGRLKFSVYNAGSSHITITRGDRLFLIWYASLDGDSDDGYGNADLGQNSITSDDQNVMHGDIASPAELKSEIDRLSHLDVHRKWILGVIAATVIGILIRLLFMEHFAIPSSDEIERMKVEIIDEIRSEALRSDAAPNDPALQKSNLPDNGPAILKTPGNAQVRQPIGPEDKSN